MADERRLDAFLEAMLRGRLGRREALRRAALLGLSAPALAALLRQRAAAQAGSPPPDAPVRPRIYALPGGLGADPYAWLENPDDPDVIAYLEAENAFLEGAMAPTAALQETLYTELVGRIKRTDASPPTPWNGYLYYTRTEEGKDYDILCRKQGSEAAPEEILVDFNTLAGEYLGVGYWVPSPDNRYLAYELDETGEEFYTIYVKEMASGQIVDQLPNSTGFEWANDSRTLLYCQQDEVHRPYALHRHEIGTEQAADPLLFQEDDPNFWLGTLTSKDRAFSFLYSGAFDSTEIHYLPADQPGAELKPLVLRQPNVLVNLAEHHGDQFLLLTDEGAPNFKVMTAPVADPAKANWRELIPHREEVLLEAMDVFEGHMALYGRENGFGQLWVREAAGGTVTPLAFEEAVYAVGPGQNWEFRTTKLRFAYSSPVTPPSTFEVDMATGERTLLKQEEVIGGHDPALYVTERLFATAADGTEIPISLVSLRDAPPGLPAGPRPLRLDGYGAYGTNSEPAFGIYRLALINRGITIAIAHVRGGAELGRRWWEEGRLLNKKTTFTDYVAAAEHLVAEGRTAPDRLVGYGGSAGGLLMGAVATARPDLFQAIIADVPAVDLIGLLLRSPIGPGNREEFGDPFDPEALAYLRSYSPYETVRAQAYPAMLVTGGFNDTRVPYWVPAKWVAKLRDVATGDAPLLLKTEMGAGHGGVSGFYDQGRDIALWYAFVLNVLGMTEVAPVGGAGAPRAVRRSAVG